MCGIFAAFQAPDAAEVIIRGLHAMQPRAAEYAGIVTFDGENFPRYADRGQVLHVFNDHKLHGLSGNIGLGHIRYSTVTDDPAKDNTQPILDKHSGVALAHNGNLTNVAELRSQLCHVNLTTSMDTELILRRFCTIEGQTSEERILRALTGVRGSYSLVFLFPDRLVAVRDPSGNRPLCVGRRGQSYFIASETCALQAIDATVIRDVEPGEILTISSVGITPDKTSLAAIAAWPLAHCIFERVYFGQASSFMDGDDIARFRILLGQALEKACPAPAEVVVPVPDSANFIAIGYGTSGRSGQFGLGLIRTHNERSFIQTDQAQRIRSILSKFQAVPFVIAGKSVALIDDSIVRLNTAPWVVGLLRRAGAKEVHVRIGFPPIRNPCLYGIDTPIQSELAAARFSNEEMRTRIGADTLEFIPLEVLQKLTEKPKNYCYACVTGEYPIPI